MSDGTVMYICELCGGSVDVEDVPDGWDSDTSTLGLWDVPPVLALPLTEAQRQQVVAWVWEHLAQQQTRTTQEETMDATS